MKSYEQLCIKLRDLKKEYKFKLMVRDIFDPEMINLRNQMQIISSELEEIDEQASKAYNKSQIGNYKKQ